MSETSEILGRLLSSEVKGDLLVLFHKNPGLIDTVDGIAHRVGRRGDSIAKDASDLVELGVLRNYRIGSLELLLLNQHRDREIQEALASYLESLKNDVEV